MWAARSSQEPVSVGALGANGFSADCPAAPPHLTGLISGSLRLVKASPALLEPAQPGAAPAGHTGAVPAQQPGAAAGPPQAPQEAQAATPAPSPQAAVDQPHSQGPPLGPSPGGAAVRPRP